MVPSRTRKNAEAFGASKSPETRVSRTVFEEGPSMSHNTVESPPATPAVAAAPSVRQVLMGDPGPLGTAAFALTTFVLSTFNAGLMPLALEPVVFGLAFFYGGMVQIFAGILEFFKNNTLGGVAFSSYGAFWMAFWYLNTNTTFAATVSATDKAHAVGLFLLGWTIFTVYMTIAVSKTHNALFFTFVILTAAFIFLTIGKFTGASIATTLGGWFGYGAAFGAWYCSFAAVFNATAGKAVVPVWPRS